MKRLVVTMLIFTSFICFASICSSQTIHRDDLKNLQFAFKIIKYDNPPILDYSKIASWGLINNKSFNQIDDSVIYNQKDEFVWFLFFKPDSLQNGIIQHQGIANNFDNKLYNKEFYAGSENSDNPDARNILTMWERITDDSLKFISAFQGYGAGAYSASWVKFVSLFPDSSYFIYIKSRGADAEKGGYSHYFVRCQHKRGTTFYLNSHKEHFLDPATSHKEISFEFDNLRFDNYQIFQTTKYYHQSKHKIIDSIQTVPINLWEIAKKHFNIVEE